MLYPLPEITFRQKESCYKIKLHFNKTCGMRSIKLSSLVSDLPSLRRTRHKGQGACAATDEAQTPTLSRHRRWCHWCAKDKAHVPHTPTLGSPVVPLVYMIVHRSLGAGGEAAAGLAAPSARNAAHVCAVMPASLHACRREGCVEYIALYV